MATSYEISKDRGLIVVTCSGPAEVSEIAGMLGRLQTDPDFQISYDVVWDASGRTASFTAGQLRELVRHVSLYRARGSRLPKRAFVVSKDVDYGMLRVYESYRTGLSDVRIEVFKSRDEAMAWIEGPD